jgi:hypothetical protein
MKKVIENSGPIPEIAINDINFWESLVIGVEESGEVYKLQKLGDDTYMWYDVLSGHAYWSDPRPTAEAAVRTLFNSNFIGSVYVSDDPANDLIRILQNPMEYV